MSAEEYLQNIYFEPSHPASFAGPEKLYRVVKREGKFKLGRKRIKQWLQDQDQYSLYRDVKRKFTRRRIVVSGVDSQWGVDLASVQNISKFNDDILYLLVAIDVFSKFLFVEPLTGRTARNVVKGFDRILAKGRIPRIVYSDKGSEFNNALFKNFLMKRHIKYFTTQNEDIKVSPVERVIRTFRNKMHRMFQKARSYRFVERLQDLVDSYNNTPHGTLGNSLPPSQVNKGNEAELWDRVYNKPAKRGEINLKNYKYNIDDLVRLSYARYTFQRDYQQKWTSELFKISERFMKQNIPVYKVKDFLNEPVVGTFYENELEKVNKDVDDALWIIENVIKKRKRAGKEEYLVKYEGWPSKFNSWVAKEAVEDVSAR